MSIILTSQLLSQENELIAAKVSIRIFKLSWDKWPILFKSALVNDKEEKLLLYKLSNLVYA